MTVWPSSSLVAMAQEFTPADRIRELNDISAGVAETLRRMGEAVKTITSSADGEGKTVSTDARKEQFEQQTRAVYEGLQEFGIKMKRQAYALEEAGVIPAKAPAAMNAAPARQQAPGGRPGVPPTVEPDRVTNNGLGKLDVGWLNSRSQKVEAEKEHELLSEARVLLEHELRRQRAAADAG